MLDCSEFLESIFVESVKEQAEEQPTEALIIAVIMFSCISLIGKPSEEYIHWQKQIIINSSALNVTKNG